MVRWYPDAEALLARESKRNASPMTIVEAFLEHSAGERRTRDLDGDPGTVWVTCSNFSVITVVARCLVHPHTDN